MVLVRAVLLMPLVAAAVVAAGLMTPTVVAALVLLAAAAALGLLAESNPDRCQKAQIASQHTPIPPPWRATHVPLLQSI